MSEHASLDGGGSSRRTFLGRAAAIAAVPGAAGAVAAALSGCAGKPHDAAAGQAGKTAPAHSRAVPENALPGDPGWNITTLGPADGIVGQRTTTKSRHSGEAAGDSLDQAQRARRCPQGGAQQTGEQRGGDLVSEVGQEAGGTDASHSRCEPPLAFLGRVRRRLDHLPEYADAASPSAAAGGEAGGHAGPSSFAMISAVAW